MLSRNAPPHNQLLRMEEGRDATKNVCGADVTWRDDTKNVFGADYDMCRWLDFLVFWDTDNKLQALTSVVNYYPWKTPEGMRVDDKVIFMYNFIFCLFALFKNFCDYACNVVAPLQNKLHKILTSISYLWSQMKWTCLQWGSSFMQYGCFGENILNHVHLQLVGLIIHVSRPNF